MSNVPNQNAILPTIDPDDPPEEVKSLRLFPQTMKDTRRCDLKKLCDDLYDVMERHPSGKIILVPDLTPSELKLYNEYYDHYQYTAIAAIYKRVRAMLMRELNGFAIARKRGMGKRPYGKAKQNPTG